MNNERDDWAQASETVLIFDQWMRAIVGTLRGRARRHHQPVLATAAHQRTPPAVRGDGRRDARAQLHHDGRLRRSARAEGSP